MRFVNGHGTVYDNIWEVALSSFWKNVGVFFPHLVRLDGHCFGYWTESVIVKRTLTLYYTTL